MEARLTRDDGSRGEWRLRALGIACRRGERLLFSGFDLMLSSGELVWLRAANGYGKTSLLRVIAGLAKPEAGTLQWRRENQTHDRHGAPLLYLAHANALKEDLTVAESLRYLAQLHGLAASDAALSDALRRFGLYTRRHARVRTLSQGQRRRAALARLCLSPAHAVWLLDEPYDALDSEGAALVGGLLAAHAAEGGCVLMTSHVPPDSAGASVRTIQLDAPVAA